MLKKIQAYIPFLHILACLTLILPAFALTASLLDPAGAAEATTGVYARHKNSVAQIRIIDRTSGSKAGIGSGFAVSKEGRLITNYHVVSSLVTSTKRYTAEYRMEDGHKGIVTLVGLDVIHDLAVLQAQDWPGEFLKFVDQPPEKGARIFSFGTPLDLGFTIVEGTYNGLLEKSMYDKIHFTGSLNPGMSGGPTLDAQGNVVGINVATAGNQVSFLVPAEYARTLLNDPEQFTDDPEKLADLVTQQMLHNQDRYINDLLAAPFDSMTMDGYTLPGELAKYFNCWGDTKEKEKQLYDTTYQACSSQDSIFLAENLSSGEIQFQHELFTTKDLGELRFYNFLETHFQHVPFNQNEEESDVTNYQCTSNQLALEGIDAKVVFCLRAYKKFSGLYDAYLSALTIDRPQQALHTSMLLTGVSFENARRFTQSYTEAIQWNK